MKNAITESDLQAFVDGQLTSERYHEIETYLQENPEIAEQVEDYRDINDSLHDTYDAVLDEPTPSRLLKHSRPYTFNRVAAIFAWISIGSVIGWSFQYSSEQGFIPGADEVYENLVRPASYAHAVYSPEVKHPVEVSVDQRKHLVAWLSKRLKTDVKAPDLLDSGFELMGGRLLPSTDSVAAQFMYQRGDGKRVTLYTRQGAWDNKETAFRYARQNNLNVFYWVDGPVGYALTGSMGKTELLKLSEKIYHQLD